MVVLPEAVVVVRVSAVSLLGINAGATAEVELIEGLVGSGVMDSRCVGLSFVAMRQVLPKKHGWKAKSRILGSMALKGLKVRGFIEFV